MTWEEFCTWCSNKGLGEPTVRKRISPKDSHPFYLYLTWVSDGYEAEKGYGIANETPTSAELKAIADNPCLPF